MATRRPEEAQAEDQAAPYCDRAETVSALGIRRADPLAEAEVVAGHGADSTLEYQPQRVSLERSLAALRGRDFRLFWGGQLVSLVGTWMQIVAQSWLVLELTNSAFALGALSALQFLPILTLSILGGVAADRLPRRELLLGTQTASLVLALALGALTQAGAVRVGYVGLLAVLLGLVNAVDMPTRQAFVVELVRPADMPNAIALNSVAFNSARLIGPAVAGLAIGYVGLAGAFYVNGLSFLPVIGALLAVSAGRRPQSRGVDTTCVWNDLRQGLRYIARTPLIWQIVLLVALVGTFAMNLNVLVPVYARQVLQVGAGGFGLLTSAAGAGSLVAALLLTALVRPPRPGLLLVSAAALGATEIVLAGVGQYALALVVLAGTGFALIFFSTLANTVLQSTVPDALRGRVMSVYTTVFVGTTPLGSLLIGSLAEARGTGVAFFVGGAVSTVAVLTVYVLGLGRTRC